MKVERRTDANQQAGIEESRVLRHEPFLLGCAQSDPDDIWPLARDIRTQSAQFVGVELPIRRTERARDVETRETLNHFLRERRCDAGFATIEIMPKAPRAAGVASTWDAPPPLVR